MSYSSRATVTTSGKGAHGVAISGNNSAVNYAGEANVTTHNNGAHGAAVSGSNSKVNYESKADIATSGDDAFGALVSGAGSSVNYKNIANITTVGKGSHGAMASGAGSSISYGDKTAITTSGQEAHGAYTKNASAVIEFKDDTLITTGGNNAYALLAEMGAISSAQSGKYTINGDMAAKTGTIDLDMAAGSYFKGKTNSGSGNISLNMKNSLWSVTGDSKLTSLNLDSTTVDYSGTKLGTVITVDTLDGPGGTFVMKTAVIDEIGDKLEVTGTMNGSKHNITVKNSGSTSTTGKEIVTLVDTADTTGVLTLNNEQDLELGAWQFRLRQVSGGMGSEWQLYAAGPSSSSDGIINNAFASYLLGYAETQTLIQRLGDLRETPKLSGLWAKVHGGSFEVKPRKSARAFDMDYWGVQFGYDRKLDINWEGELYAGVMFGYSRGKNEFANDGSGKMESKTLGAYGTFISPNGFFADLVLKHQWVDSGFEVFSTSGSRVKGDGMSSNGYGISLELGQRVPFADEQKTGWYIEPQVQLSSMKYNGGSALIGNGMRVEIEPYTSLLGRLGALVGYEKDDTNFYAKVSKVKEFRGDVTILANSKPIDTSFGGSWWVYGLGFTSRLDERNSIYMDIERAEGGMFTQKWAAKAGWRIEF